MTIVCVGTTYASGASLGKRSVIQTTIGMLYLLPCSVRNDWHSEVQERRQLASQGPCFCRLLHKAVPNLW